MEVCGNCGSGLPEQAERCPKCGFTSVSHSQITVDNIPANAPSTPPPPISPTPVGFAPGSVFAGRYRIIALLGRGGMGEVYRADDLKLGHAVALKFLPQAFARDSARLDAFRAEVRNTRQVSHPNVCRVYDIGEEGDRHFLSMEYIDGEDLASLLRRIGRLPPDKALEIARQLCSGLAAAHEHGLVHRDLKPANVMLDGRGRVRITDFGLAVTAGTDWQDFAGTPVYMAPEQLAGKRATVQSDLYSLGLVLYEVHTGKRVFEGKTTAELRRKHTTVSIKLPSSITAEMDPAMERALMRCLEEDPAKRPASAMELAASLPGGDPLAAAIAAGETPSPEMVAAAGAAESISPRAAIVLMASIVALLFGSVPFARRATTLGVAPLAKPPDVFAERAQEVSRRLGYEAPPADTYGWMELATDYLRYRARNFPAPQRVRDLVRSVPGPYRYYFRQSPRPLVPLVNPTGIITPGNPPFETPGEILLVLDGAGHLLSFRAEPPKWEEETPAKPPDWAALFAEAGLDLNRFRPVASLGVPDSAFDARAAWEGTAYEIAFRVQAAAFHGKPVFFDVSGPWTPRPSKETVSSDAILTFGVRAFGILFVMVPIASAFLARRNWRLGRGDTKGAMRAATFVVVCRVLTYILGGHHPASILAVPQLFGLLSQASFFGLITWLTYMALEPLIRRNSPHLLISWTRLLSGRFRDSLVGRDLAFGVLAGCLANLIRCIVYALPWWFNIPGLVPLSGIVQVFSVRLPLAQPGDQLVLLTIAMLLVVFVSMATLFLLALGRLLFQKNWAAVLFVFVVALTFGQWRGDNLPLEAVAVSAAAVLQVYIMVVYGPVAYQGALFTNMLLAMLPFDPSLSTWYAPRSVIFAVVVVGLAAYGLRCALAGQPLLAEEE